MPELVVSTLGSVSSTSNTYCTLGELKTEKGISDTVDDSILQIAINAATSQINNACGWRFWQDSVAVDRDFSPETARTVCLIDDPAGDGISTTTGLVVKVDLDNSGTYETTLAINTDFIVLPRNAAARTPAWPYTDLQIINQVGAAWFPKPLYGQPTIRVTAKWGWPAVPDDIHKACLIQAQMLAKSKDAPFGQVEIGGLGSPIGIRGALHPFARALIDPYRKPAIG